MVTRLPSKQQSGAAGDVVQDAAWNSTDLRKAPRDMNRIPGSTASMTVQERKKDARASTDSSTSSAAWSSQLATSSTLRGKTAIQAMQPFLDSSTTSSSPIQPTDIQLLTKSILSNQERQRVILYYQEQLIHSEPSLSELKKSLLFLSSSSWGQILEERKLAEKCSYPRCSNASPSRSGATNGRFRINLRNKSVKAIQDLDLGEAGNTWDDLKEMFCSKKCYARSEWILRWVLGECEIGLEKRDAQDRGARGGGGVLGGKWQKLTSQGGYEQVELLEDIERESGLKLEAGEMFVDRVLDSEPLKQEVAAKTIRQGAVEPQSTGAACQVTNLLQDLTIVERRKDSTCATPGASACTNSTISTASHTSQSTPTSKTAYDVDVPNTLGSRFTRNCTDKDERTDDDTHPSFEQRQREISHILRYASLAKASRLVLDRGMDSTSGAVDDAHLSVDTRDRSDDQEHTPVLDAQAAAERAHLRRIMDDALDVRRDQRELGLLD